MKSCCNVARCAMLLLLMAAGSLAAQGPGPMLPHAGLPPLQTVSTAEFRAHLDALRGIVLACERIESACDPARVGDDNYVNPGSAPAYIERLGWLRDLLEDRGDPSHAKRTALLPHADERLQQQIAELDQPVAPTPVVSKSMQSARSGVLSRKEFRTTSGYSLGDRLTAWFSQLLERMFGGVSSLGRMAPWLGTAVQWSTLLLAATLLVLWAYRALDRQRVTIGRLGTDAANAEQHAESRMWASKARAFADQGEWREAVHALYWASIIVLEDRRTLRRSGTRTPREALRLIDPASHLREPLQAQTGEFERIWYGLQQAEAADYESALTHYKALQAESGTRTAANA
jgi:hypothetical protein